MNGSARHLFARGNTARGSHFLYESAFQGLNRIYLLEGPPGAGKSTVLKAIADDAIAREWSVELFHSPLNPDDLDALLIRDLNIGVADGRVCKGFDSIPGAELVPVDFGAAVDLSKLSDTARQEIGSLSTQISEAYERAYETFLTALRIHDEWEAIYISSMDFGKADQVAQELEDTLFGDRTQEKAAVVRHLFFGAATPLGAVDHIPTLTAPMQRRILIKGRPGSGKSTMLKRLARTAEERGFDVEVFHCGFDPNSLDMLLFAELGLAIFDSTAPHEYFPSRSSDEILDMYERTMRPGTDEQFAEQLQEIQQRYSEKMKEATAHLKRAQQAHARLKSHYTALTDFGRVEQLCSDLQNEIAAMTPQYHD